MKKNTKILLTGAGGPAAICAFKSLSDHDFEIHMADMDGLSAGLYFVPDTQRHVIPSAKHPDFVQIMLNLCKANSIDILIPTVDFELEQLALNRDLFELYDIQLLLAEHDVLQKIMNKYNLLNAVFQTVDVGQFDMLAHAEEKDWKGKKIVVKPISGSGSRGVCFYEDYSEIPESSFDNDLLMIQEFASGPEYSVDVMIGKNGEVKAAVPRVRMRTDSGVSVTGKIENNKRVIEYVKQVVGAIGLTYMANVQVIDSPECGPRLIEINPRFSGGLSLVIASGANTPLMSINELLGKEVATVHEFKEIAMVRSFTETFMNAEDLITA